MRFECDFVEVSLYKCYREKGMGYVDWAGGLVSPACSNLAELLCVARGSRLEVRQREDRAMGWSIKCVGAKAEGFTV